MHVIAVAISYLKKVITIKTLFIIRFFLQIRHFSNKIGMCLNTNGGFPLQTGHFHYSMQTRHSLIECIMNVMI